MKLNLSVLPLILTTMFVSGCQSVSEQFTNISNASIIGSFSNLELWSKQFVGLSKKKKL